MLQSATPAMRNEATRCLKPPKVTPFAKLAIGTAIRPSRDRRRTENSPLDPQSETGTLATHSGKTALWQIMIQSVWEMTNLNLPCTESLPTASSGFPRLSFILNCVSHAMSCNARLCECLSVPLYVSMVMQCNAKQYSVISADPCRCHCRGRRPRQRSISSGLFSFTGRQFRS